LQIDKDAIQKEFDSYKGFSSELDLLLKMRDDYASTKGKYERAAKLAASLEDKLQAEETRHSDELQKLKDEVFANESYALSLKAESDNKDAVLNDMKAKNKDASLLLCVFSSFVASKPFPVFQVDVIQPAHPQRQP
jgi:hypothetical protein